MERVDYDEHTTKERRPLSVVMAQEVEAYNTHIKCARVRVFSNPWVKSILTVQTKRKVLPTASIFGSINRNQQSAVAARRYETYFSVNIHKLRLVVFINNYYITRHNIAVECNTLKQQVQWPSLFFTYCFPVSLKGYGFRTRWHCRGKKGLQVTR